MTEETGTQLKLPRDQARRKEGHRLVTRVCTPHPEQEGHVEAEARIPLLLCATRCLKTGNSAAEGKVQPRR